MDLAYADEGPGPVVVLLHGFPLSRAMWDEQLAGLGSIYRVIAPDLRGLGESPVPEGVYTMDAMADDVVELLETLEIMGPVVVGGLSMGGYVALSLAARYPTRVRALMLMDTHAAADTPEAAQGREATAQAVIAADSRRAGRRCDDAASFLQDDPGTTSRAGRTDQGRDGARRPRKGSPAPCAAWRAGPTGGATCPRSPFRRWLWSARKT